MVQNAKNIVILMGEGISTRSSIFVAQWNLDLGKRNNKKNSEVVVIRESNPREKQGTILQIMVPRQRQYSRCVLILPRLLPPCLVIVFVMT
jgi:hypothetical protein